MSAGVHTRQVFPVDYVCVCVCVCVCVYVLFVRAHTTHGCTDAGMRYHPLVSYTHVYNA